MNIVSTVKTHRTLCQPRYKLFEHTVNCTNTLSTVRTLSRYFNVFGELRLMKNNIIVYKYISKLYYYQYFKLDLYYHGRMNPIHVLCKV